ncbi:MAG: filamentous hemagglutinin N-terminal domain-containing protein [Cyanobacteria bacterium P01_E01_bin.42]
MYWAKNKTPHTKICTFLAISLSSLLGISPESAAQIVPDNTLNGENSIATPQGNPNDLLITGGARRNAALFHSFQEFNINELQQVYFTNPDGIFNILTRVTGENFSQILGTLGVDGSANFFLINPNGIYFGENARLDLRGSFTATTADSIFIDNLEFSATNPETPPILTLNINPGIQYGNNQRDREIQNTGNLSVDPQQNLTLFGGTTINRGNLTASRGRIELLGTLINVNDNSQVDVSASTEPGTILIGGDYRGQGNTPTADRVYIGENVSILANADGAIGNGGKAIVWANEVAGFYGEIQARGGFNAGDGGFVEVSGKEYLIFSGAVDVSAIDGENGTVLLDPRNITFSNAPNLPPDPLMIPALSDDEILSGDFGNLNININIAQLTSLSGNVVFEATENIIVAPDIDLIFTSSVSSVLFSADADNNGTGDFIMNQNRSIITDGADIQIQGNNLSIGGIVTTDSSSDSGAIALNATGDISLFALRSDSTNFDAGSIDVVSSNGSIEIINRIDAGSINDEAAPVYLEAAGDISFGIANNLLEPAIDTQGDDLGGDITIISQTGTVSLSNSDLIGGSREGDGGDITVFGNSIDVTDSIIFSEITGNGDAGTISLEANDAIALNNSFINTDIALGAVGLPGDILMNANTINLDNSGATTTSGGTVESGNIQVTANSLTLQNDSTLNIFSLEDGGDIDIFALDISLSDRSKITTETNGTNGGNIAIDTDNITLRNNSSIFTDVRSATGIGGNIEINATGFIIAVLAEDSDIFADGDLREGNLTISAQAIWGFNTGEELTGESDILGTVTVTLTDVDELDRYGDEFEEALEDDESRDPFALRQLPEEFVRQCGTTRDNEITIAGRSGMRTNPNQFLRGREIWQDRRDISTLLNSATIEGVEINGERGNFEPLTEAHGWRINERGNVELIGEQALQNNFRCQTNNSHSLDNG